MAPWVRCDVSPPCCCSQGCLWCLLCLSYRGGTGGGGCSAFSHNGSYGRLWGWPWGDISWPGACCWPCRPELHDPGEYCWERITWHTSSDRPWHTWILGGSASVVHREWPGTAWQTHCDNLVTQEEGASLPPCSSSGHGGHESKG